MQRYRRDPPRPRKAAKRPEPSLPISRPRSSASKKIMAIRAQKAHTSRCVGFMRRMPGYAPRLANRRFAINTGEIARKRSNSIGPRQSAPTWEGHLDEVATRNGDIQASVPDQGHRTPAAGGCLRSRDRRRADRRPVVSMFSPDRHHDHGSRLTAATFLDRDDFHQFGRSCRCAAGRRGLTMNQHRTTIEALTANS
jgi:hypothetical protein